KEPEVVYGVAVDDNPVVDQAFIELPLGEGDVPFAEYLKALEAVGYRGFLTIEREVGNNPAADIALAARFLREKMR
ncbi:MAG: TIM barrel protein, partial [Clostridia bacterium]